ncbi:MAG: arginine--tRNA ligase [Candidatus Latescibacterota bacterium]|nr:arginine--tRNA ligase [Candidatus Latescibacterota bacterium]
MNPFVDDIVEILSTAAQLPATDVAELLAIPPDDSLGDYALPCFTLAKVLRKNPAQIAQDIADAAGPSIDASTRLAAVQAAGPYVNVRLEKAAFIGWVLAAIGEQGESFGSQNQGAGRTVTIDFSSPNLARPFSIAHLRSTAIGHAIYRIHEFLGYRCVGINHYGDYGANFGQLLTAYQMWGDEQKVAADPVPELLALYVRFNDEVEKDPDLREESRSRLRRLADGDEEMVSLWRFFVDAGRKEAERIYGILGVHFDEYKGEGDFADDLDSVIGLFHEKGLAEESDGALIVRLKDEEGEEGAPCMLRTSNGTSTYHSRDIAALLYRKREHAFDKMVYVTDNRQALHFRQVFQTLSLAGIEWIDRCEHAPFGMMSFKGQALSTRKGRMVILEDVLDQAIDLTRKIIAEKNPDLKDADDVARQIGISAVVYADVSNRRTRDISFSLEEVLNFDGETGPYLQYTHARYCSILRRYGTAVDGEADPSRLGEPAEMRVARALGSFPGVLARAERENEPSYVATFLIDLATQANKLYNEVPVLIAEDPAVKAARIRLVDAVRGVLRTGITLLGMSCPEEM